MKYIENILKNLHGGMQVKHKIFKSNVCDGVGLFADEYIKKGTITWICDDIFCKCYTNEEYNSWNNSTKNKINFDDLYWINQKNELCFPLDKEKYINHSRTSNLGCLHHEILGEMTYAKENIKKGDEFLIDYREFVSKEHWLDWY
jgi:SET domain-containing protein